MVGYGRRWAVETALSTFKRQYGEYCIAKHGKHRERTRGQSIHIQHTNKPIRQNQKHKIREETWTKRIKPQSLNKHWALVSSMFYAA